MTNTNEFSVTMNRDEAELMLAGIARLTGGMSEMFGDNENELTDGRRDGEAYSRAKQWTMQNYETAAGATSLIYSAAEILLKIFQDNDVTITD